MGGVLCRGVGAVWWGEVCACGGKDALAQMCRRSHRFGGKRQYSGGGG
jgi:hypothetical protein